MSKALERMVEQYGADVDDMRIFGIPLTELSLNELCAALVMSQKQNDAWRDEWWRRYRASIQGHQP